MRGDHEFKKLCASIGFKPTIVTPGVDKFRQTHEEPFRTIITGADAAIETGNSFLCVGYGFNDENIQPKLVDRCKRQGKSIVILAKELTEGAKNVLLDGKCGCFLAFEKSADGTRIFSQEDIEGVEFKGLHLWQLKDMLELVLV